MSYYTISPHHYYGHRAPSPPHAHPSPPYGSRHPPHPHHAPPPAHTSYDLDEEERLALAHLRAIRQRREAQQAALEREAALRAKEERDNALRRARAEKKRQQAIAEAAAALKRQREKEIQEAVQREREQIRAAIIQQQYHRQTEDHRRQQLQAAQQEYARQVQAKQARPTQSQQPRQLSVPKVCQRSLQPAVKEEVKKENNHEYDVLNQLLGNLFGITLEDEYEKEEVKDTKTSPIPAPVPVVAQAPTPAPPAPESGTFPNDINDLLSQYLGLRIEPTTESTPSIPKPTTLSDEPANSIPQGLNDFLSRYGLVFEPEESSPSSPTPVEQKVEVPPTSVADPPEPVLPAPAAAFPTSAASTSAPQPTHQAKGDHPLTDYFNGMVDLPPFLRNILGHAEVAYNDRRDGQEKKEVPVEGKGKGVAEGEKNAIPTPAPIAQSIPAPPELVVEAKTEPEPEIEVDESVKSLSTLSTISSDLHLVRESFDFPSTLAFATPSPDNSDPPALLYNKVNSGYHAQTHKLLQLLLAADAIQSNGNKEVRRRRKEIVREVEEEIERLEKKRDEMWEQVKKAREEGEVENQYEMVSNSSCASSAVDPSEVKEEVEHVEDVESAAGPSGYQVEVPSTPTPATPVTSGPALAEEVKDSKAARVEEAEDAEEVKEEK